MMPRRSVTGTIGVVVVLAAGPGWSSDPLHKNPSASSPPDEAALAYESWSPGPSSKNSDSDIWTWPGRTTVFVSGEVSKNSTPTRIRPQSPVPSDVREATPSVEHSCGSSGNLTWATSSGAFEIVRQCTLTVPSSGYLFISANGSLFNSNGEYEGQFRIGVDSTAGDFNIDRWVNVYDDSGDGTDRSVALSVLKEVTAGTHTVYFLGRRYSGAGEVTVFDPTLSAIFSPIWQACGSSGNLNWTTSSAAFEIIRQCTLTVASDGFLLISADGSLFNSNGEYEGQFRIDVDGTAGDFNIDRWVNIYNDSGDGTDESVALTVRKPVTAGTHTVYFLGGRYSGTAEVGVYDPTLSAIFVPALGSCGASGNMNWTTVSASNVVIRQCSVDVPKDGSIFISVDGSLFNSNGEYEAQFQIDVDSTVGDPNIDRWVNVYNDSGDGSDRSVALTVMKEVPAGTHTVYFLGSRYSGTAEVGVFDPTLSVWGPGFSIFSDGFESGDTSAWSQIVP